jgi:hypothetical protein
MSVPHTLVSPSPRDLVAQLLPDERVAVDLILEQHLDTPWKRLAKDEDQPNVDAPIFTNLVPDKQRRGYLLTLAGQLRALGITLDDRTTAAKPRDT